MNTQTELWTADDLSELLRVSKSGIYNLVREQKIPRPLRIGKSMRWDRDDVMRWLNRQKEVEL